MASDLNQLEKEIMAEMEKIYTKTALDHAMNPRNVGNLPDSDGFGRITGPCGNTMEMWLKVQDGKITQATFWTDGCGPSIACGSVVTVLLKGTSIAKASKITPEEVLQSLGGLPEESTHCAILAANTLKEAIKDYLERRKKKVWLEFEPDLSNCIETLAKREHERLLRELLRKEEEDEELMEKAETLRLFLESTNFGKLRSECEKYFLEGKGIKFTIYAEEGKPKYKMEVL